MFDAVHPSAPVSAETIRRIQPLMSHILAHEVANEAQKYDPVNATRVMAPLLLKRVFDPTSFIDALFFDVFAGMAADAERAIKGFFRVYVDGMLSPRLENEALFSSPVAGESFRDFVSRAAGGKKLGIIINGTEQWSDPLARIGARVFAPVIDVLGNERSTIEVTLFIGDYGYTPFGIHIDDAYTSVVHFHVGPATKAMTLFSKDDFHRLNGPGKNCFDPDRLIPYGETFSIDPGDVFLLPPHWYHVGKTDDFSIGVAFAISKYPNDKVTERMLQHAISEPRLRGTFEEVVARADAIGESMADWLRRVKAEYRARAASRCWLRYSYARYVTGAIAPEAVLRRDPDFPLTTLTAGEDFLVFARGNHIRLKRGVTSAALLDAVPHIPFCTRDLHTEVKGMVSHKEVSGMLAQLHRLGGLLATGVAVQQ